MKSLGHEVKVDMRSQFKKTSLLKLYKTPLCMTFAFLLGCMFAINIVPMDKNCKIDDSDKEYNIMNNSKLKNPELIILILSAPNNTVRRNIIRQTWLKLVNKDQENIEDSKKFKVKHFFAIGSLGLNIIGTSQLTKEQHEHNDILILPMYDSYRNITLKVLKSFEWLSDQYEYGLLFKYVLKCDDDSFVRLDHLVHEIQHIELLYLKSKLSSVKSMSKENLSPYLRINIQSNINELENNLSLYWGYFVGKSSVQSKGKWKEENWIACDKYLPYALGGGYILSKQLVTYIAKNIDYLRVYSCEDVSVGFWLLSVNNVLRIHDIRFDTEWVSRGCQNFFLIMHNNQNETMHKLIYNIQKNHVLCSKEYLKRKYYYYNWTAVPSQCCHRD